VTVVVGATSLPDALVGLATPLDPAPTTRPITQAATAMITTLPSLIEDRGFGGAEGSTGLGGGCALGQPAL
jgi:hypothetical protein